MLLECVVSNSHCAVTHRSQASNSVLRVYKLRVFYSKMLKDASLEACKGSSIFTASEI